MFRRVITGTLILALLIVGCGKSVDHCQDNPERCEVSASGKALGPLILVTWPLHVGRWMLANKWKTAGLAAVGYGTTQVGVGNQDTIAAAGEYQGHPERVGYGRVRCLTNSQGTMHASLSNLCVYVGARRGTWLYGNIAQPLLQAGANLIGQNSVNGAVMAVFQPKAGTVPDQNRLYDEQSVLSLMDRTGFKVAGFVGEGAQISFRHTCPAGELPPGVTSPDGCMYSVAYAQHTTENHWQGFFNDGGFADLRLFLHPAREARLGEGQATSFTYNNMNYLAFVTSVPLASGEPTGEVVLSLVQCPNFCLSLLAQATPPPATDQIPLQPQAVHLLSASASGPRIQNMTPYTARPNYQDRWLPNFVLDIWNRSIAVPLLFLGIPGDPDPAVAQSQASGTGGNLLRTNGNLQLTNGMQAMATSTATAPASAGNRPLTFINPTPNLGSGLPEDFTAEVWVKGAYNVRLHVQGAGEPQRQLMPIGPELNQNSPGVASGYVAKFAVSDLSAGGMYTLQAQGLSSTQGGAVVRSEAIQITVHGVGTSGGTRCEIISPTSGPQPMAPSEAQVATIGATQVQLYGQAEFGQAQVIGQQPVSSDAPTARFALHVPFNQAFSLVAVCSNGSQTWNSNEVRVQHTGHTMPSSTLVGYNMGSTETSRVNIVEPAGYGHTVGERFRVRVEIGNHAVTAGGQLVNWGWSWVSDNQLVNNVATPSVVELHAYSRDHGSNTVVGRTNGQGVVCSGFVWQCNNYNFEGISLPCPGNWELVAIAHFPGGGPPQHSAPVTVTYSGPGSGSCPSNPNATAPYPGTQTPGVNQPQAPQDRQAPSAEFATCPAQAANGDTLQITANDDTGIASVEFTGPSGTPETLNQAPYIFTLSGMTPGSSYSVRARACDAAGQCATASCAFSAANDAGSGTTTTTTVETPQVMISSPQANTSQQVTHALVNATVSGSGVAKVSAHCGGAPETQNNPDSSQSSWTVTFNIAVQPGTPTCTVTAENLNGETSEQSVTFTVEAPAQQDFSQPAGFDQVAGVVAEDDDGGGDLDPLVLLLLPAVAPLAQRRRRR